MAGVASARPKIDAGTNAPLVAHVTAAEQTRRNYEQRPYPGTDRHTHVAKGGALPSLRWVQAVGRPGLPDPQRILVAGCGSGAEAFFLRRLFPHAEIVAVDFSPRSITLARRLQRAESFAHPIQFQVGDLTDPGLPEQTGGHFGLITCHGVLSYIPQPEAALAVLADCLRPDGALYLGVNGEAHPATRLRPWLARFGLEVAGWPNERRLRELLGLWDALHDDANGELASMPATYLAGDVCGFHFNNWSLAHWRQAAQATGWELASTGLLAPALHLLHEGGQAPSLFPAPVGEIGEKLDQARPAGFHRLVLRRASPGSLDLTPDLRSERPWVWTGLYTVRVARTAVTRKVLTRWRSSVLDLEFTSFVTARQAQRLVAQTRTEATPRIDLSDWNRNEASRRLLWLWTGFGVVAPAAADNKAPR